MVSRHEVTLSSRAPLAGECTGKDLESKVLRLIEWRWIAAMNKEMLALQHTVSLYWMCF